MHERGIRLQLPECRSAGGNGKGWAAGILLLGAALVFAARPADAAPLNSGSPGSSEPASARAGSQEDFVGSDVCASCHADVAKRFAANPHSVLAEEHGKAGVTCESCHGPGKAHVEGGGDKTKIFNPARGSAKQADAMCLACHQGQHANFERSAHGEAGVSCVSCHTVHAGADKEHLLKAAEPGLCFQCHADVKPQFGMPFHHKVEEGLMTCSDCHNPHGTFHDNQLKSTADQNAICTRCHMETRGPFVYEHAVVKGEGCLACHTPHGSQNARLMNMPNINPLCNQCHSSVAAATVHGMSEGSTELTPCISCHTMIHGSNLNQAFIR